MRVAAYIYLLILTASCTRIRPSLRTEEIELHEARTGIEVPSEKNQWYYEFSCFDDIKTGRIFTTFVSDIDLALGFFYEMETAYDLTYLVFNDRFLIKEKTDLVHRPQSVKFEVAYCYYKSWRDNYSEFNEPDLLYMSVRLK